MHETLNAVLATSKDCNETEYPMLFGASDKGTNQTKNGPDTLSSPFLAKLADSGQFPSDLQQWSAPWYSEIIALLLDSGDLLFWADNLLSNATSIAEAMSFPNETLLWVSDLLDNVTEFVGFVDKEFLRMNETSNVTDMLRYIGQPCSFDHRAIIDGLDKIVKGTIALLGMELSRNVSNGFTGSFPSSMNGYDGTNNNDVTGVYDALAVGIMIGLDSVSLQVCINCDGL